MPSGSVQMFAGSSAPTGWLLCNGAEVAIASYGSLYAVLGTTYGSLTNGSGGAGSTHFRLPDARSRAVVGAGTGTGLTARTLAGTGGAESVTLTSAQSGLVGHGHANTIAITNVSTNIDHNHSVNIYDYTSTTGWTSGGHSHNIPRSAIATAGSNRAVVSSTSNQPTLYVEGQSADHYHSASHGHTGSSGYMGTPSHSHANTLSGGVTDVASANASASHENMMPFLVLNYIIKT